MISAKIEHSGDVKISKYPYIGVSNDGNDVVLFTKEKTGFSIFSSNTVFTRTIGHHADCWAEDDFTPFKGKITLSNG